MPTDNVQIVNNVDAANNNNHTAHRGKRSLNDGAPARKVRVTIATDAVCDIHIGKKSITIDLY